MASQKQLAANRANASLSTGPKTESGKTQSRKNAWKHGLTAKALVIYSENPDDFDLLRASFEAQFKPRDALQHELVERLAVTTWRLRRIPAFEAALIEERREIATSIGMRRIGFNDNGIAGLAVIFSEDTLGKLSRYESALLNVFNQTLHQLIVLQDRDAREAEAEPVAKILPTQR